MNLLERLRSIEWVGPMMPVKFCPACGGGEPEMEHEPDCWLDQKIKQLEVEPADTGAGMVAVVIEAWKEIDHAVANVRAIGVKEMADKLERLMVEKHG